MLSAKKQKSIVGLDIEADSAAATEVGANGTIEVLRHGVIGLEPGAFSEGEVIDPEALGKSLKELFSKHKLSREVRLGVANQRVAVRVMRLPALEGEELESAIRFQAQDHIPMPLEQAVLDWRVINRVEGEAGQGQVDVVAVAARRDMLAAMLDTLRRAGLRPVGIDHSSFGMIRALAGSEHVRVGAAGFVTAPTMDVTEPVADYAAVPADPAAGPTDPGADAEGETAVSPVEGIGLEIPAPDPVAAPQAGKLYCSLADATNLAVTHEGACLFTRVSPFGVEAIAQRLAERQQLTLEDAHRWLVDVGLEADPQTLDGDPERVAATREALTEGVTKLADELRMSLDFYAAQETAVPVEGVVACGRGTTIPGLVEHLQREVGRPFEVARPTALNGLDETTAARLTLPYGLALER